MAHPLERRRSAVVASTAVACGTLFLTGCAGLVRQASETAVPIVVDSGLGELATPKSQAQLKSIAASPAVQEAGYGVGLGIGRGILDEGSAFLGGAASKSDEPPTAVGVAATTQGGAAAPTAGAPTTKPGAAAAPSGGGPTTRPAASKGKGGGLASFQGTLTPFVGDLVRSAVTEGMGQATGPEGRAQVRATAEAAGDGLVAGLTQAAERDAGPVVGRMVHSAIADGLNQANGPEVRAQLRSMAEAAGDGFASGLSKAAERDAGPAVGRIVQGQINPALDDAARRLGPILREVLSQQVEPVVRDLVAECVRDTLKMPVRPENAPDVIANAHNVSTGAGQATHEALVGMGVLEPSGRWSLRMRLAMWGVGVLGTLVGVATLVLLVLGILIAGSEWRRRRGSRA